MSDADGSYSRDHPIRTGMTAAHFRVGSHNELKIDRGFVRGLAKDGEDAAIVFAIIALGKTLNLKVVDERLFLGNSRAEIYRFNYTYRKSTLISPVRAE